MILTALRTRATRRGLTRSGRARVCVVGPSTRFLSGITYYTYALCNALVGEAEVCALLMRRLLPAQLYPGRDRVGAAISDLRLDPAIRRFDGVDWFWLPSLLRACLFLLRRRPDVLVLQWWTGTTLHTYLALAQVARRLGAQVVIEFHESQDPGEALQPLAQRYVRAVAPRLFRQATHYVAHSEQERAQLSEGYGIDSERTTVIPHATYGHYRNGATRTEHHDCNLLFFGVIRPFKGLEDLVRSFEMLAAEHPGRYRLTVVGETWEGWTLPSELISASPYADRVTFINRYVADSEVDAFFSDADIVVLPYRRSTQSGPLHVAMNYGLPVVVSAVGGLVESVEDYAGAVTVEPNDPVALAAAIRRAEPLISTRFEDPRDWGETARRYAELLAEIGAMGQSSEPTERSWGWSTVHEQGMGRCAQEASRS